MICLTAVAQIIVRDNYRSNLEYYNWSHIVPHTPTLYISATNCMLSIKLNCKILRD